MKRLEYVDYAKALAIFLVVLGHTNTNGALDPAAPDYLYVDLIYAFHMPLFIMLGGFFIRPKETYSLAGWRHFLARNFLALMVPYFIWGVVYMAFSYTDLAYLLYGSWYSQKICGTLTSLWYLPAFFLGKVVCEAVLTAGWKLGLRPVVSGLVSLPILFALGAFLPHGISFGGCYMGNPWGFDIAFVCAGFMTVGRLVRPFFDRLSCGSLGALLTTLVVSAGVFAFGFARQHATMTPGVDNIVLMCGAVYGDWFLFLVNALSGSAAALAFTAILSRLLPANGFLLFVGVNTMGVYLLHKHLVFAFTDLWGRFGVQPVDVWTGLLIAVPAFFCALFLLKALLSVAPAVFGKSMGKAAAEAVSVAVGREGSVRTVEKRVLGGLLSDFSRRALADGKIDIEEAAELQRILVPLAEERGGAYAELLDVVRTARADGVIDTRESANISLLLLKLD